MSRLEPDELTRLLAQAVEPIRPDPAAYQRIKEGIAWRRRWRAPGFALTGIVAATLVVLAVLAVQPGPSAQLVEPATPLVSSREDGASPDPSNTYRIGSGGTSTHGPDGNSGSSPGTRPPSSASATPTLTETPDPPSTPPEGGSASMPPPTAVPAADGDVDGDGSVEALRLVGTRLEVTMTRGADGAVLVVDVPNAVSPLAATVTDLDRDGYGEIVVQTGAESGVKRYSVLRLAATDEFTPVGESAGVPLVAAGIDTLRGVAYGFRCSAGSLTTYAATTSDLGATFTVVTTNWRLDGDAFSQVDSDAPGTSTTDRAQFAAACGDLR